MDQRREECFPRSSYLHANRFFFHSVQNRIVLYHIGLRVKTYFRCFIFSYSYVGLPGGTLTMSESAAYSARGRLLLLALLCFSAFVGTEFTIDSTASAPLDLDRLNGGESTRDSDVI